MVARKPRKPTHRNGGRMKQAVYHLVNDSDSIVESMMSVLAEEGPRPMKNLRPTQKQPTGAEKFQHEHNSQYDARSVASQDRISQVHRHNRTYPAMSNELDKKRSIANPTAFTLANSMADGTNNDKQICCNCLLRIKHTNKQAGLKKRDHRTRKTRSATFKPKNKRFNTARKHFNFFKVRTDRSCQFPPQREIPMTIYECEKDEPGIKDDLEKTDKLLRTESRTSIDQKAKTDNMDAENPFSLNCPIS